MEKDQGVGADTQVNKRVEEKKEVVNIIK